MAIVINGSGTITGISTGGLPDGIVDDGTLATSAVTSTKIADGTITNADVNDVAASKLTGALPAIDGSNLTGVAALPSGGSVGQIVTNTSSGTGTWQGLTKDAYQAGYQMQEGWSYKIQSGSTSSTSQVDAIDFGVVGTVQKGSYVIVTMKFPLISAGWAGCALWLDFVDNTSGTRLNHIYFSQNVTTGTIYNPGMMMAGHGMTGGTGTTTFSVKCTIKSLNASSPVSWWSGSYHPCMITWSEKKG
jgi:hypothetical protein